jgi:hypothetical protein
MQKMLSVDKGTQTPDLQTRSLSHRGVSNPRAFLYAHSLNGHLLLDRSSIKIIVLIPQSVMISSTESTECEYYGKPQLLDVYTIWKTHDTPYSTTTQAAYCECW